MGFRQIILCFCIILAASADDSIQEPEIRRGFFSSAFQSLSSLFVSTSDVTSASTSTLTNDRTSGRTSAPTGFPTRATTKPSTSAPTSIPTGAPTTVVFDSPSENTLQSTRKIINATASPFEIAFSLPANIEVDPTENDIRLIEFLTESYLGIKMEKFTLFDDMKLIEIVVRADTIETNENSISILFHPSITFAATGNNIPGMEVMDLNIALILSTKEPSSNYLGFIKELRSPFSMATDYAFRSLAPAGRTPTGPPTVAPIKESTTAPKIAGLVGIPISNFIIKYDIGVHEGTSPSETNLRDLQFLTEQFITEMMKMFSDNVQGMNFAGFTGDAIFIANDKSSISVVYDKPTCMFNGLESYATPTKNDLDGIFLAVLTSNTGKAGYVSYLNGLPTASPFSMVTDYAFEFLTTETMNYIYEKGNVSDKNENIQPTNDPTALPTNSPTSAPSNTPTATPTNRPTNKPTSYPTKNPTIPPTMAPFYSPRVPTLVSDMDQFPIRGRPQKKERISAFPASPFLIKYSVANQGVEPSLTDVSEVQFMTDLYIGKTMKGVYDLSATTRFIDFSSNATIMKRNVDIYAISIVFYPTIVFGTAHRAPTRDNIDGLMEDILKETKADYWKECLENLNESNPFSLATDYSFEWVDKNEKDTIKEEEFPKRLRTVRTGYPTSLPTKASISSGASMASMDFQQLLQLSLDKILQENGNTNP